MTARRVHTNGEAAAKVNSPWRHVRRFLLAQLLVVCYGGSYLWLGAEWRPGPGPGPHPIRMRVFPNPQLARFYQPAVWFESQLRGYPITSGDPQLHFMSSP
ncbi:MAG: hypothetical protein QGG36_29415 [Pirellulaceae bacterium]|nr:hypothetical protein [Pirellulaceae bacterium]